MDPAALAQTAAKRFIEGDESSLLACFDDDLEVYWEPALSNQPIISSRAALAGWLERTREPRKRLNVSVGEPSKHGDGVLLEVIVVQQIVQEEVWRLALAACVSGDLIREVRAFWAREAAMDWLTSPR